MKGWIKLHRRIKENWLYQEKRTFSRFEAWVDLLLEANHKDNKFPLGNEIVECKRGQLITSVRQLCDRWRWSNTKVTNFLKLLQNDNMITYFSDTKKTVITIVNYELYQSEDDTITTNERHDNDARTTREHTNKNDKNVKNDKNILAKGAPAKNSDKVPAHCQDPTKVFLDQVSSCYTTLTGRWATPKDEVAIADVSHMTLDYELVKKVMTDVYRRYEPRFKGDQIRSFKYFIPAIKSSLIAKKQESSERKMLDGEHSKGNIDRRTLEIIKNSKKEWDIPEVNF